MSSVLSENLRACSGSKNNQWQAQNRNLLGRERSRESPFLQGIPENNFLEALLAED